MAIYVDKLYHKWNQNGPSPKKTEAFFCTHSAKKNLQINLIKTNFSQLLTTLDANRTGMHPELIEFFSN